MYRVTTSLFLLMSSLLFTTNTYAQYVVTRVDINPGSGYSVPREFTAIDTFVYFQADDGTHGLELWRSDGTVNGTVLIKDINSGLSSSNPIGFAGYNGKVYFAAGDASGTELWVTDGTANGTKMVKDINSGPASSNPEQLYAGLGKLFFVANDGSSGSELWVSDGTAAGTKLLKDINSGNKNSDPDHFHEYKGKIYFEADDGSSGNELWITDGTASGTKLIRDIGPGTINGYGINDEHIIEYNNQLVFTGYEGVPVYSGIWTTDGTTTGTKLLVDPTPGTNKGRPVSGYTLYHNKLYFVLDSSDQNQFNNHELAVTDLTQNGTHIVKHIFPNVRKSGISQDHIAYVDSLDLLFFQANDSTHGRELWKSDGTAQGTQMVKDITNPGSSSPSQLTSYGGKLFFAHGNNEFWYTDGTDTGTHALLTIPQGKNWFGTTQTTGPKTQANGSLFLMAEYDDSTGRELWIITDTAYKRSLKDTSNNPPQTITDITSNNFKIAPNPAHNSVHISFDKTVQNATISLTDISGKLIHKEKVAGSLEQTTFKLPTVSPGIYLINVTHSDGSASQRLRIE